MLKYHINEWRHFHLVHTHKQAFVSSLLGNIPIRTQHSDAESKIDDAPKIE
jgi:hypothetical protein